MDGKDIKPWETGKKKDKDKDPDAISVYVPLGSTDILFAVTKSSLCKIINLIMEEKKESPVEGEPLIDIILSISIDIENWREK